MIERIGRFEIRRELGRGAQSVVYLAFDPQLQRQIAIKTLHFTRPDPTQNQVLLGEARMVSQLRHANIVPIYEAGEEDGDLYLVFEYVPGRTLHETLRQGGALPPAKAATLMIGILGAVRQAHEQGIIHRDLKPSNVLLDENGQPRVMDFGIAAQVDSKSTDGGNYVGTPAYMAPEYIDNRVINQATDVFSAGLIFYEMLTGQRAVQGDNVFRVMNRIASEDLRLPESLSAGLDERLVDIVAKSIARHPGERYGNVEQFVLALENYLESDTPQVAGGSNQSTLDFLLRRMRHKSDFPALSESVSTINKIAASETESINKLSASILKDFSLTNKILRLVNSAYYRQVGGGNISTVSRAIIVLGFDAVRNIAITMLLFEHLQNKANANQLKEAFLRANLAASIAKAIATMTAAHDLEQAFICSMFHGLGRLLSQYYFPEESEEIRKVMVQKECDEGIASLQVLGIGFEDLGIGIARSWGFPGLIVNSMRSLPAGNVRKPEGQEERLRVLSGLANELCNVVAQNTAELRHKDMKRVLDRFGAAISVPKQDVEASIKRAVEEVAEFSRVIHLNLQQTTFGRQMRQFAGMPLAETTEGADPVGASLDGTILRDAPVLPDGTREAGTLSTSAMPPDAQSILTAGIQDISNTLVDGFKLNDILRIILETMYRAMGFKRVILCIKDARNNVMQGRFGFGPDAVELARHFRFPLSFTPDIFHAATSKGADILISDIDDAKIATRIPEWYRKIGCAKTFVLFPLNIKSVPVALIYADCDYAGEIVIPDKELSLLRTLRNQAVLAIKQGS
jgi:eukaryotic-like serine/threonine-protein kinase